MDKNTTSWTVTLIDAGDGSGDFFLPLPDALLKRVGWEVGDCITAEAVGNTIVLKKHEDSSA